MQANSPFSAGRPADLGIGGKSLHAARSENRSPAAKNPARSAEHRRVLHDLTRAAGSLLYRPGLPVSEQHSTCWCHRGMQRDRLLGDVDARVFRRRDGRGARLDGVITCGNVWTCPVCSNAIRAQRREELEHAAKAASALGLHRYLLTLTFPHQRTDSFADILARMDKARQSFRNSRAYKRVMGAAGRIGSACALEVTHSDLNGWHPHTHDLVFAQAGGLGEGAPDEAGNLASPAIDELKSAWLHALERNGLLPHDKVSDAWAHALNVRGGLYAADYIAKYGREERWSLSRELTEHVGKVGRPAGEVEHLTPFQLLDRARRGDDAAGALFREYATVMKGKRALNWSPGLKATLNIRDMSDEAAAQRADDNEHQAGHLTAAQLAIVTSRAGLGELLQMVAMYGATDGQRVIDDVVEAMRARPPTHGGTIKKTRQGETRTLDQSGYPWRAAA